MLPDKGMCLYQVMISLHFLNDIANDTESTQKIDHYVILASLKVNQLGKLINGILDSSLLIIKVTRLSFENAC